MEDVRCLSLELYLSLRRLSLVPRLVEVRTTSGGASTIGETSILRPPFAPTTSSAVAGRIVYPYLAFGNACATSGCKFSTRLTLSNTRLKSAKPSADSSPSVARFFEDFLLDAFFFAAPFVAQLGACPFLCPGCIVTRCNFAPSSRVGSASLSSSSLTRSKLQHPEGQEQRRH
jgi:hypothetical protein